MDWLCVTGGQQEPEIPRASLSGTLGGSQALRGSVSGALSFTVNVSRAAAGGLGVQGGGPLPAPWRGPEVLSVTLGFSLKSKSVMCACHWC